MPSAEYQAAMGGSLKMKGVKDASVAKKKHKKKNKDKSEDKKTPAAAGNVLSEDTGTPLADDVRSQSAGKADGEGEDEKRLEQKEEQDETPLGKEIGSATSKKTEAELRHEERRRKRLDERLRREGVQTHKQRVEQLNKYLSGLSEHHDMPRIGPG